MTFCLGSADFGLAGCVLFLSRLFPRIHAHHVTSRLDGCPFGGVELTGGFTVGAQRTLAGQAKRKIWRARRVSGRGVLDRRVGIGRHG